MEWPTGIPENFKIIAPHSLRRWVAIKLDLYTNWLEIKIKKKYE